MKKGIRIIGALVISIALSACASSTDPSESLDQNISDQDQQSSDLPIIRATDEKVSDITEPEAVSYCIVDGQTVTSNGEKVNWPQIEPSKYKNEAIFSVFQAEIDSSSSLIVPAIIRNEESNVFSDIILLDAFFEEYEYGGIFSGQYKITFNKERTAVISLDITGWWHSEEKEMMDIIHSDISADSSDLRKTWSIHWGDGIRETDMDTNEEIWLDYSTLKQIDNPWSEDYYDAPAAIVDPGTSGSWPTMANTTWEKWYFEGGQMCYDQNNSWWCELPGLTLFWDPNNSCWFYVSSDYIIYYQWRDTNYFVSGYREDSIIENTAWFYITGSGVSHVAPPDKYYELLNARRTEWSQYLFDEATTVWKENFQYDVYQDSTGVWWCDAPYGSWQYIPGGGTYKTGEWHGFVNVYNFNGQILYIENCEVIVNYTASEIMFYDVSTRSKVASIFDNFAFWEGKYDTPEDQNKKLPIYED